MQAARFQRLEIKRKEGKISGRAIRRLKLKNRKTKGENTTTPWKGKRKNIRVCIICDKEKNKKKMRKNYQDQIVCKSHGM